MDNYLGDGDSGQRLALDKVRLLLLKGTTWRYLRYLHMLEGFLKCAEGVQSVLAVGAGKGFAELALAVEFPSVNFLVTDIESERTPNYGVAKGLAQKWGLQNVCFGVLDVLADPVEQADLVTSIEVLEHIEDDAKAARNMLAMAKKHVFCLVPFAAPADNADPEKRRWNWERFEHYRVGYNAADLRRLFGDPVDIRGCYWSGAGQDLRRELTEMPEEWIEREFPRLIARARGDIIRRVPKGRSEALGIWILT